MDSTCGTDSSSSSSAHGKDFIDFFSILEACFDGNGSFFLGVHVRPSVISSPGDDTTGAGGGGVDSGIACSAVGTVVVTLERPNNVLVLGAFVAGQGGKDWEYWEGKFGPSQLAEHRNGLGWEGHTLEALGKSFMASIEGVQSSQADDTETASTNDAVATLGRAANEAANDQQQRPPCLSRGGSEGAGGEGKGGGDTTTLDLHYADPDIVGSWRVRLVQAGLCGQLVESMQNGLRAASARPSTNNDGDFSSSPKKRAPLTVPSPGKRRRGGGAASMLSAQRRRAPAKGATLMGARQPAT